MLEHQPQESHESSERTPLATTPVAAPAHAEARLHPRLEARIEDYLDRIFARLVVMLPYEERQTRRTEMRAHLDMLIVAHTELGASPEAAVDYALAHFQKDYAVATQAVRETQQTRLTTQSKGSARPATLLALGLFGLPYLAVAINSDFSWNLWKNLFSDSPETYYRFLLLPLPLLLGLLTGLLARRHAARGALTAIALLAIPAILLPGLLTGLNCAKIIPDFQWPDWLPNPLYGYCGVTFWAGMGCLGAAVGGKARQRLGKAWKGLRTRRKDPVLF